MITRRLRQLGSAATRGSLALGAIGFASFLAGRRSARSGSSPQDQGESSSKRDYRPASQRHPSMHNPEAEAAPLPKKISTWAQFYMHKGDVDAAIGRFQDAADVAPNLAKPRLLLAEAYEKKDDKAVGGEILQGIPAG